MARPLRVQFPGACYHVTSRGNERKSIYKSIKDREQFLSYLESAHERYGAIIHIYCLMTNHYHLVLETPRSNLSQILHHINGAYTTYFNVKRKRTGHLFQGRYKAILIEKDAYFQELSRYIHLNPIRAAVVERPSEYPWSSYPSYIGIRKYPEWLTTDTILGYFGEDRVRAMKDYRKFVEEAIGKEMNNPLKEVFATVFLGNEEFIKNAKDRWIGFKNADIRNLPALRDLSDRPSLERIEDIVSHTVGKEHPNYKKLCLYLSHQSGGYTLRKIGSFYGMRGSAVSQSTRRFKQKIEKDEDIKKLLNQIKKELNVET